LRVVPNHACVVSNLFDAVHILEGGKPAAIWPVVARGKVT
jgi:D-serine deaminase-like pyridoxal phosphate-dependent protein